MLPGIPECYLNRRLTHDRLAHSTHEHVTLTFTRFTQSAETTTLTPRVSPLETCQQPTRWKAERCLACGALLGKAAGGWEARCR